MKYINKAVKRAHFYMLRRGNFLQASVLSNIDLFTFSFSLLCGAYLYTETKGSSIDSHIHDFKWAAFIFFVSAAPIKIAVTYRNIKRKLTRHCT